MSHLDDLGWVAQHTYSIGEVDFGIRTTSEAFARWLQETLGEYRSSAEARPEFSIVVGDGSTPGRKDFNVLYRGTITWSKTFHLPTLARTLLSHLESIAHPVREDAIYTDCSVVRANGRTALVPSSLVAYVASLGRRVGQAGLALPVDSFVAVDPATGVVTSPRPELRIPPDAFDRLEALFPSEGIRPDGFLLDGPIEVDAVCSIGETPDQVPFQPVTPGTAVYRMADHVVNLRKVGRTALDALVRMVDRAGAVYELDAAGPKDMMGALLSLGRGSPPTAP